MVNVVGGAFLLTLFIALIVCGIILHMWHILKDIANEDADERAERKFRNYVENCEYRVHTQMRIVDEMGRK